MMPILTYLTKFNGLLITNFQSLYGSKFSLLVTTVFYLDSQAT